MRHISNLVFFLAIAIPQLGNAQILPRFTRAKNVCYLPDLYDLSEGRLSNPVSALSFKATDVALAGVFRNPESESQNLLRETIKGKTFRMAKTKLENDHCRISQVAVMIDERGCCSIDLLAEQNPALLGRDRQSAAAVHHRNRFVVTVRPLVGVDSGNGTAELNQVVPPAADSFDFEFWLERGRVRRIHQVSPKHPAALARAFQAIDRVAIDLRYE